MGKASSAVHRLLVHTSTVREDCAFDSSSAVETGADSASCPWRLGADGEAAVAAEEPQIGAGDFGRRFRGGGSVKRSIVVVVVVVVVDLDVDADVASLGIVTPVCTVSGRMPGASTTISPLARSSEGDTRASAGTAFWRRGSLVNASTTTKKRSSRRQALLLLLLVLVLVMG